jgi:hypothetical protein
MITTQLIPATLVKWSKNRRKIPLVMRSAAKYGSFLGIAFSMLPSSDSEPVSSELTEPPVRAHELP